MDKICDRSICTGCGLCASLCPKSAIKMSECENTGHYIPIIDNELCVDCKLCVKNCPSLQSAERHTTIKCYAAWREDKDKLQGSSSGGVASAFYETAIENDYVCAGTYLTGEFQAKMKCVSTYEETEPFKGSKYIQADSNYVYNDCLDALKIGKKVLFIGTPCQCAAMRTAAGEKYKEELLTVELICHGTPSYKIFREYVSDMERKKRRNATSVSFRTSWGEELTLKENNKAFWKHTWLEDDFLFAFQKGMLFNESCYDCKYANKDRCSDITIGDFWKIGTTTPFTRPDCKVSAIVVNTEKGEQFLNNCSNLHLEEREYDEALAGNPNLHRASARNPQYDIFWSTYHNNGLRTAFDNTIGPAVRKTRIKNKIVKGTKKKIKFLLNLIRK